MGLANVDCETGLAVSPRGGMKLGLADRAVERCTLTGAHTSPEDCRKVLHCTHLGQYATPHRTVISLPGHMVTAILLALA